MRSISSDATADIVEREFHPKNGTLHISQWLILFIYQLLSVTLGHSVSEREDTTTKVKERRSHQKKLLSSASAKNEVVYLIHIIIIQK